MTKGTTKLSDQAKAANSAAAMPPRREVRIEALRNRVGDRQQVGSTVALKKHQDRLVSLYHLGHGRAPYPPRSGWKKAPGSPDLRGDPGRHRGGAARLRREAPLLAGPGGAARGFARHRARGL